MKARPLIAVLLGLGAGAGYWVWANQTADESTSRAAPTEAPPKLALVQTEVPLEAWAKLQAQAARKPLLQTDSLATLIAAAETKDTLEARLVAQGKEPRADSDYLRAHAALQTAAIDHAHFRAPEELVRVGRQRSIEMIRRFEALLSWCQTEGKSLAEAFAQDPWPPVVADAAQYCGSLGFFAERGGLLKGVQPVGNYQPLLHGIFMEQWVSLVQHKFPARPFLTADERQWYLRWQVERNAGGPLPARLDAAKQLARVPGYPSALNTGVLLYNAGQRTQAAAAFATSEHAKAAQYRKLAE